MTLKLILFLFGSIPLLSHASDLDSLKSIDQTSLNITEHVDLLVDLSKSYRGIDNDSAFYFMLFANDLSKEKVFAAGYVRTLIELGILTKNLGKFSDAIKYYHRAIAETNSGSELRLRSIAMNNLGSVYKRLGMLDSATYYILESIELKAKLNNPSSLISSYINLANILVFNNQEEKAIEYYRIAHLISVKNKDSSRLANIFLNIGNAFFNMDSYDSSEFYYTKSLENSNKDERISANINLNIGNIHFERREYLRAIQFYELSLVFVENADDSYMRISLLNNLGNSYRQLGEIKKATTFYIRAIRNAIELNSIDQLMEVYKNLSICYELNGDLRKSLSFYKKYSALDDSLYNIRASKQIAELQTKYETEKKEKEIVTQKVQIQQATTERNSLFMALAIAFLLFGVAIVFYVQRNRTVRAVAEKKVEVHRNEISQLLITQETKAFDAMIEGQEKERKRVAEELHDRLGSTLSATKMHFEAATSGISETNEFEYVNKLLDKAIEDTRQISHNMLSGVLTKFGLVAALKDLKETIMATGQLEVKFETIQFDERLELEKEINLYRIAQELVSNTLRHAEAEKLYFKLEKKGENLELLVQDDGKGIEDNGNGIGLRNIDSRVNKMNGSWKISSMNDGGTEAIISISV